MFLRRRGSESRLPLPWDSPNLFYSLNIHAKLGAGNASHSGKVQKTVGFLLGGWGVPKYTDIPPRQLWEKRASVLD